MIDPTAQPDEQTETDELLAAYLDNELSDQERSMVETRLADDDAFRLRLVELDRTWDMLDSLPKADLDDEKFVRTTVEMITVQAAQEVQEFEASQRRTDKARKLGLVLGMVALVVVGYLITQWQLNRPDRILVENLTVIESVDELQLIEDIEFLEALKSEGLFTGENDDES
ncbi:hypothetical protein DTL42_25425 [Bremerella cremea]|uniref:Zinc-finger domain-containing protein n=1 Tax=Bremerella cremea TaxID=1031537 RepID=A0A368KLR3_9BACT|nr:hypothetical protein [Bremerella cremea]RCS40708.1 hypothetical protein DTL42_25425 [Bremerella cremea]